MTMARLKLLAQLPFCLERAFQSQDTAFVATGLSLEIHYLGVRVRVRVGPPG